MFTIFPCASKILRWEAVTPATSARRSLKKSVLCCSVRRCTKSTPRRYQRPGAGFKKIQVGAARLKPGRSTQPTLLIVAAQSVKNTDTTALKGYDAGKKVSGIKRWGAARLAWAGCKACSLTAAARSSAALPGWTRTGGYERTASDISPPTCNSSTWHSWPCCSGDREQALRGWPAP